MMQKYQAFFTYQDATDFFPSGEATQTLREKWIVESTKKFVAPLTATLASETPFNSIQRRLATYKASTSAENGMYFVLYLIVRNL